MNYTLLKSTLTKGWVFLVLFLVHTHVVFSQTDNDDEVFKKAHSFFELISSQERFIDKLSSISGEEQAYNLPIGIKKIVGNIPITLAITNIKFNNKWGEVTLLMKMDIPQKAEPLIFGASNIKITNYGDLVGDVRLSLLSDIPISMGNAGKVILKGSMDNKTGEFTSNTFVELDCNGDFKQMSIDGDILLNKNTFIPINKSDTEVKSSFNTTIFDWNDLIVEASFPAFEIKGAKDFEFNLTNATLDLSDFKNPSKFNPIGDYATEYLVLPEPNLWRGLYIDTFTVTLPPQFKNKGSNERITMGAARLLIDENGVTGDIFGKNVIPLDKGDAGGWSISVSDFRLSLMANNIRGFGFGGQIDAPISEKVQPLDYEAFISNDEYLFRAELKDDLDFKLFGDARLRLDSSSMIHMSLRDNTFRPKLVMNGAMYLESEGLKIEELAFSKLMFSTESPYFSVETMTYGGEIKLYNFPISISNFQFSANNDLASLAFDLKLNLMKDKIAANSRLKLTSQHEGRSWTFKGVDIEKIALERVQLAGFSLDGAIYMSKDDPVYGNYFGGDITATFDALSNGLKVNVISVFGNKGFRYWYVEGKASFAGGIPIGPVFLNGFVGGAYYRMAATGGKGIHAYAPEEKSSLGLKAGVSYHIGTKTAVNGDAVFEMNFLSGGGIRNIRFYGSAKFMDVATITGDKLGKLGELHNKAMSKLESLDKSLADKLPANMHGSDVTKNVLPDLNLSMGVTAYLTMDYNFPTKTFDADFKVMVETPGGFLRGAGNNGEAGWAKLYCSPQTWYIHVGKPSNPVGLKLGLGPLSLSTESYFMLGHQLESPKIDPELIRILRISPQDADYMKFPDKMSTGKGIAFGTRMKFDTGDLTFLILYARFMAGMGFDVALQDLSAYECAENPGSNIGINGWYANGQVYAYLQGELGIKVKLLFIKKKFTIISGSAGALLQAKLPSPTWIGGYMALDLKVLGGLIKANMKMRFDFGDKCTFKRKDGEYSPLDYPIIGDLSPADKATEVDVFTSPQAVLNMKAEEEFSAEDEQGNSKTYRIKLEDFYITNKNGQRIVGGTKWNANHDAITFESHEILPPYEDFKATIAVNFEEFTNGGWRLVTNNGKPARESKSVEFKTGGAPNYIPLTNIEYCYPVIGQKNFFKDETNTGYVQLKKGQSYLFPKDFIYNSSFTNKRGTIVKSDFRYNESEKSISYTFPSLSNKNEYQIAFVAYKPSNENEQGAAQVKTTTKALTDDAGESFSVDYMQQAAQKIISEGSLEVLNYDFTSSKFNTFEQKMSSLKLKTGSRPVSTDVRSLLLLTTSSYELFDEIDLVGNNYTANKPLIYPEAILDDNYYTKDIEPLIYRGYPRSGVTITNRDVNKYGVPPSRALPIYEGYLGYVGNPNANASDPIAKRVPFIYELPYYYYEDYKEMYTKAANSFDKGINMGPLMPFINNDFPFIRKGTYKAQFKYVLPGGKLGTNKQVEYYNIVDIRE